MLILSNQIYLIFGRYNPERTAEKMCLIYSNTSLGHSTTVTTNSDHQFPIISFFLFFLGVSYQPSLPTVGGLSKICSRGMSWETQFAVPWLPSNGKWDTVCNSLPPSHWIFGFCAWSKWYLEKAVSYPLPLDRITKMGLFPLGMGCKTHSLWGWWSDSFPKSEINMAGWKKNGFKGNWDDHQQEWGDCPSPS